MRRANEVASGLDVASAERRGSPASSNALAHSSEFASGEVEAKSDDVRRPNSFFVFA